MPSQSCPKTQTGEVTFLDTKQDLNGRVDEMLGEPTVERLIAVVTEAAQ